MSGYAFSRSRNGVKIDAKGMGYKQLNELIHQKVNSGKKDIILDNVNGQRYIGDGLSGDIKITINGVPGNDLAAFMDGPTIVVNSNAQDGIGNTMNAGKIIVYGDAGDIVGHSMRGGEILVRGDVGYRVGIHMKSYKDFRPVVIIGGCARNFLGEYMAGGLIVVLGLNRGKSGSSSVHSSHKRGNAYALSTVDYRLVGGYCGIGMHGGTIYLRGSIENYQLGEGVKKSGLNNEDRGILRRYLKDYCTYFSLDLNKILNGKFMKLLPSTLRPYGKLYAY